MFILFPPLILVTISVLYVPVYVPRYIIIYIILRTVYQKEFYWGSIMPIKRYNLNYLEDFEQFKSENDEFWLLVEGDIPTIKGFETTDYVDFELNFNAAKYTKAPQISLKPC